MASPDSNNETKENVSQSVEDPPEAIEDTNGPSLEKPNTENDSSEQTSNAQASATVKDVENVGTKPPDNEKDIKVKVEQDDDTSRNKTTSDNKMGAGAGGNPLWAIVWLLILIFISFFVAGFCAGLYIFLSLFTPCIPALTQVTDFLMKGINFVNYCSSNMINMRPLC